MIRFEQVTKRYSETEPPVFDRCDLMIGQGEFILLTGRSGAGKTTLLKMLLKETEPTSGRISVMDRDISSVSRRELPFYRRKFGVVFQDSLLIEDRTVYENVEIARRILGNSGKSSRTMIASLLSLLGITPLYRKYPRELSGGERQKVCLARALVNYPPILLADEPTGNLSYEESREIWRLFGLANRQGITVVAATHDKGSAEGLAYREIALEEKYVSAASGGMGDGDGYGKGKNSGTEADGQR